MELMLALLGNKVYKGKYFVNRGVRIQTEGSGHEEISPHRNTLPGQARLLPRVLQVGGALARRG